MTVLISGICGNLGTRIAKAKCLKEKSDIEAPPIGAKDASTTTVQKQELHHVLRLRAAGVPIPKRHISQRVLKVNLRLDHAA